MFRYTFLLILLLVTNSAQSQFSSVSLEVGGVGGFGSINYSYRPNKVHSIGGYIGARNIYRVGLSYAPIDSNNGAAVVVPLMYHTIFGGHKNYFETGIGQAITLTTRGNVFVRMPLNFGYRYDPEDGRFFFRAAYTPIISYLFNFQWEHWGGVTVGLNFNRK